MNKILVFNNTIDTTDQFGFTRNRLDELQRKYLIAGLFEQLLLFDRIVVKTNRSNFALTFLINELGINKVEELIDKKYLQFLLWTPVIVTGTGRRKEDGTIDTSTIMGKPPIATGSLSDSDSDPEIIIDKALSPFNLSRDRKRIFKRLAANSYIIPKGMEFSAKAAEFVIESYKANLLSELGLPYDIEPEYLAINKRYELLTLGQKIIETSLLSKYELKSFDNYEHIRICQANLRNIGNALNVTENTSEILRIENILNLKQLFLSSKLDIDDALQIRNFKNAKYYRKWINEISENTNASEITKEYLKEISGKNKYFDTAQGKLLRTLSIFGLGTSLGYIIGGVVGSAVADLGLSLLDTYWLESILKGKNPKMFIDELENKLKNN